MTPSPKVAAGGASGAFAVVLVFVAGQAGVDVPPEVAAAVSTLASFVGGYLKR